MTYAAAAFLLRYAEPQCHIMPQAFRIALLQTGRWSSYSTMPAHSHALSMAHESCRSRMALASTMLRTMKRLIALSLGTIAPLDSQRTRLTCAVFPGTHGAATEQRQRRLRAAAQARVGSNKLQQPRSKTHVATALLVTASRTALLGHIGRLWKELGGRGGSSMGGTERAACPLPAPAAVKLPSSRRTKAA